VEHRWRAAKINEFILKFNFVILRKIGRKTERSERYFSWLTVYGHGKYLLTTEFRFNAMLCFITVNENSDAGHINCSYGPQVPHPCFTPIQLFNRWHCAPVVGKLRASAQLWDVQHLLLWAVRYVKSKVLHRLHGIKHRLLQQLLNQWRIQT